MEAYREKEPAKRSTVATRQDSGLYAVNERKGSKTPRTSQSPSQTQPRSAHQTIRLGPTTPTQTQSPYGYVQNEWPPPLHTSVTTSIGVTETKGEPRCSIERHTTVQRARANATRRARANGPRLRRAGREQGGAVRSLVQRKAKVHSRDTGRTNLPQVQTSKDNKRSLLGAKARVQTSEGITKIAAMCVQTILIIPRQ